MEIPKQLQNLDFRFVLIRPRDKAPYEMQWQKIKNYSPQHRRLEVHKGNLGIVAGYGNLVILDIDDLKLAKLYDDQLKTFSVETGSGGRHFYFLCEEKFQKSYYVLGNKQGELRCSNSQVVVPGSTHPNGNQYKVISEYPIIKITKAEIKKMLGSLLNKTKMVDTSRSGVDWSEVCGMVQAGYNFDDTDREMKLMEHSKWIEAGVGYRIGTYCNALRKCKGC